MKSKILVVEDESVVALDIEDSLTKFGYEVVGIESYGEKALERAVTLKPDLVLMDIRLKGETDGIQACAAIKQALNLPVIFLTAYADEGTLQRAKTVVPDGYILKPFEGQELRAAIELVLYRSSGAVSTEEITEEEPLSDVASFLNSIPLFKFLPSDVREGFFATARSHQAQPGETLFEEGAKFQRAPFLMTGRGALIKSSPNGKELIVEVIPPGDPLLALMTLVDERPGASARIQAPSTVVDLPLSNFRALFKEHPASVLAANEIILKRLTKAHERTRAFAHDAAELRLATALLSLTPHFARAVKPDGSYSIFLTRQELADLAGTTPETAIRVTKSLERDGLLDLTRPGIIRVLEPAKFEAMVHPAS